MSGYWSPERVEQLRALWFSGLSATQVARKLGGVTRNAVIGIVHRRGWAGRDGLAGRQAQRTYAQRRPPKVVLPPPPPPPEEPPVVLEDGSHVTIMQLTADTCRWPIGDPRDADFHFCGHKPKADSPYCEPHHRKSYAPQPKKRQDVDTAKRAQRSSGILRAIG